MVCTPLPILSPITWIVLADALSADLAGLILGPLIFLVMSIFLFYGATKRLQEKRLMENVPTSKCKGVMMGLNELKGEAVAESPVQSYLAEEEVIYYKYEIKEQYEREVEEDGKTKTERKWKTVKSRKDMCPFVLQDDTGEIRVNPEGASFEGDLAFSKSVRRSDPLYYDKGPERSVSDSTGRRRFKEWVIRNEEDVYVMGDARLREDAVEPEIAEDETAPMFLISSKSEDALIQKYGRQGVFMYALSIVFGAGAPAIFFMAAEVTTPMGVHFGVWSAGAALGILILIALSYVRTIYNGLVDLRNREDRAWAMLDVEFQRRADLIPNLAAVVQTVAAHEKQIQKQVAEATPSESLGETASEADPEQAEAALQKQSGALARVVGVAEDYPEIASDEHFQELMDALTHCEDRIALAKQFYNNSVECLNDRVDTIPDKYVAPLAGAETEDYLSLEDFEKTSVDVGREPAAS